jgi:hypothetical protein
MSLLRNGTETVTVFPEEVITDSDGNIRTRPSAVGVVARAVVQPVTVVGASSEGQTIGFQTESTYRLRLVNWPGGLLGAQSQIEWQGKRYVIDGEPRQYNGSPRTRHVDYAIKRY